MDLIPIKIDNGEEKAWGLVCGLPREEVCRNTGAGFDEKAGACRLRSAATAACSATRRSCPCPGAGRSTGFIALGGRIPALVHSFKN